MSAQDEKPISRASCENAMKEAMQDGQVAFATGDVAKAAAFFMAAGCYSTALALAPVDGSGETHEEPTP